MIVRRRQSPGRAVTAIATAGVATLVVCSSLVGSGAALAAPATRHPTGWSLDPTFGRGGVTTLRLDTSGERPDWAYAQAIQPNGRIVVGGVSTGGDFDSGAVARLLASGEPDPSFAGTGRELIGRHPLYQVRAMALQHVGGEEKILLAVASTFRGPYRYRCSILRLNPDGSLDTDHDADPAVAFGGDGIVTVGFAQNSGFCEGLAVAPNGDVVVSVDAAATQGDVGLFRLRGLDGSLDPTFGVGGRVTLHAPGEQFAGPVALTPAAGGGYRILVGGSTQVAEGDDWAVWEVSHAGAAVASFGTRGRVTLPMRAAQVQQSFDSVNAIGVGSDGTVVVGGDFRAWPAGALLPQDTAALAELTPGGARARGFGHDGVMHIPYDGRGDTDTQSLAVRSNGSVVYTGGLSMPTSGQFLVGGVTAAGLPDRAFGQFGFQERSIGGGPYTSGYAIGLDGPRLVVSGIAGAPNGSEADAFGVIRLVRSS